MQRMYQPIATDVLGLEEKEYSDQKYRLEGSKTE